MINKLSHFCSFIVFINNIVITKVQKSMDAFKFVPRHRVANE